MLEGPGVTEVVGSRDAVLEKLVEDEVLRATSRVVLPAMVLAPDVLDIDVLQGGVEMAAAEVLVVCEVAKSEEFEGRIDGMRVELGEGGSLVSSSDEVEIDTVVLAKSRGLCCSCCLSEYMVE